MLTNEQMSDWYSISREAVIQNGGRELFRHHSSLEAALRVFYSTFPWESSRFIASGRSPRQRNLLAQLEMAENELGITKVLPLHLPPFSHLITSLDK